ncbi:ABC transporter substrate-binding protein [Burkholderia pseudomallei]|uniref:ABC transporter substrate-binding protein n=1 Tax=Burkholderia pseudomallei TaxID=28450 RepID=A0A8A4EA81_BURPE|nr:ABC transporter substrate-binding protein [Burkholderia pseudomallei]ABN86229.1 bacterial extracellular solute-binding protein, family 5 [Burkholderia pseudomallei 668]AJX90060.1 bacterial extracellular solute-binding s, 5 Middle family protein [Burkholderia pseudomallei]KGS10446.1 bacterial extracellular solute-binding s, 5 Middle family protein [Burkholderia pseudomallei MSHR7504]QWM25393.1 ABC transporter substrate-binding protein [Burkholderia pseudomallei]QWV53680.1 ABC transporter sub
MKHMLSKLAASAALAALAPVPAPAHAATPPGIFVIATQLGEFTTLDPGEIYELVPSEYVANTYERLVRVDLREPSKFEGRIAQSWSVGADGLTYTFKLRTGLKFHSGNPVTADDVAWSLQRTVLLDKGPAGVLADLGLTKDNVARKVRKLDDTTVSIETDRRYAPSFVLNVLSADPASIVDKQLLLSHEKNGDFGNAWLKNADAGSGPYRLVKWTPNESLVLQRFDGYRAPYPMKRIVLRHVPEASAQRLLLENGDVDAARNLSPDSLAALSKAGKIHVASWPVSALLYLSLNTRNPNLAKPEVQEAMKWLVDYDGIQRNIVRTTYKVHQTFLPDGFLGALDANPYRQNVAKAKALLAKAGLPNGFAVTMDMPNDYPYVEIAQALQANFAQGGIQVKLIPGDAKQAIGKYRARQHDIFIGEWSPDYMDPNSNARGFAWNPDNSDNAKHKLLAWRNGWDVPQLTAKTDAALAEPSAAKRAQDYQALQKAVLANSPFVILFEKVVQVATRPGVTGPEIGPINDLVSYRTLKK